MKHLIDVFRFLQGPRSNSAPALGRAGLFALLGMMFTSTALGDDGPIKSSPSAGNGMYSVYPNAAAPFFGDVLGDDYPIPMDDLLPALLRAINQMSKYPLPKTLPPVYRVPHSKIEALVCTQACAALATYRPGEGIYIDDGLKPESSIFARSVLLHELVHYLQDMTNELGGAKECERWYRREQEAYAIQKRFLMLVGSQIRVAYSAGAACDPQS